MEKRDQRMAEREQALKAFQAELNRRVAELDGGEGIPAEQVFAELRAKPEARRRKPA
jgi:hypothetical protein